MIRANLALVIHLAKRYRGKGLPFEDLVSEGNLGLIRAVDKYDLKHKTRFSTYACWWITQTIQRAVKANRLVHVPIYLIDKDKKKKSTKLYQNSAEKTLLADFIPIDSEIEDRRNANNFENKDLIENIFLLVDERAKRILELHSLGFTHAAIGRMFDLSRERIRQIKEEALATIYRSFLNGKHTRSVTGVY
jgi:RNA polymerase sigma factor (sigma-70 family)